MGKNRTVSWASKGEIVTFVVRKPYPPQRRTLGDWLRHIHREYVHQQHANTRYVFRHGKQWHAARFGSTLLIRTFPSEDAAMMWLLATESRDGKV